MHHMLVHLLQTYGYWGLLIGLALEYVLFPLPGETTLTAVGILYQQGSYHLNLELLLISTALGAFLGTMLGYGLGRVLGRPFLDRLLRYVRVSPQKLDQAESVIGKYTVPTLIVSRYISGIRLLVPYLAGIQRVPLRLYIPVMAFASTLWTSTFILSGQAMDRLWRHVFVHIHHKRLFIVLLLSILLCVYVYRKIRRKTASPPSKPSADSLDDDPIP